MNQIFEDSNITLIKKNTSSYKILPKFKRQTKSWTNEEESYMGDLIKQKYSYREIAIILGRNLTDTQKRLNVYCKNNDIYNLKSRNLKYEHNKDIFNIMNQKSKISTVCDLFAGGDFWKKTYKKLNVVSNDMDEKYNTDYNCDANLLCDYFISNDIKFDFVDVDSFTASYPYVAKSIAIAKKFIMFTVSDIKLLRWKSYGVLRKRYNIPEDVILTREVVVSEFDKYVKQQVFLQSGRKVECIKCQLIGTIYRICYYIYD